MSLLLAIIYISFISLGLPDALLGSAWPAMQAELKVPFSYAGIISMTIAAGTVISSFFTDKLLKKLGTGKLTACSIALTAISLLGFSFAPSFTVLCILALPYGLGAGAVDAALNNYVALYYKASHMNFLHCFWGVGVTIGPFVMGACLADGLRFSTGYQLVAIFQLILTFVVFLSLPLWKKQTSEAATETEAPTLKKSQLIHLPGVKAALCSFFLYCAIEQTAGLWGASYMVITRGISAETAARLASLFYIGITVGRFTCGFAAMKLSNKTLLRTGVGLILCGILMLLAPLGNMMMFVGFILIGVGCAPVYPGLIHDTPRNFGAEYSQSVIGLQMASSYVGTTFMPTIFGFLADHLSIRLYPFYLLIMVIGMAAMIERLNRLPKKM